MNRGTLGLLGGLAIGVLGTLLWVGDGSDIERPTDPVDAAPVLESVPESLPEEVRPECYLGVVIPRNAVDIAADMEGQLDQVLGDVGQSVDAGAALARLDTQALEHELAKERAALAIAKANLQRQDLLVDRAQQEYSRLEALEGVVSKADLALADSRITEAEILRRATRAEVQRAEVSIQGLDSRLERSVIRAPFPGTVASRLLAPGAIVGPGTPILRLISHQERQVRFAVPASEPLVVGAELRLEVSGQDRELFGSVQSIAPEVDPASRMLFIVAELANTPDRLATGTAVRVSSKGRAERCGPNGP